MSATPSGHYPSGRSGPSVGVLEVRDPDEISVLSLVNVVLRHRGLVVGVAFLCLAALLLVLLIRPRNYAVTSSFLPKSRGNTSAIAGLAAQFGLGLPTLDGSQSPDFYLDLLATQEILGQAVDTHYEFQLDGREASGTLVEAYRIKGATPGVRREKAIEKLRDDLEVDAHRTGIVEMTVTSTYPSLSLQVNSRLLDLLNQFNLKTRQSQAGAERRFTQQRLSEVQDTLRAAEERLQTFLQRNRDYRNSPLLTFQQERLAREISRQQQLYNSLSEAFEQAKIEEVRDTPVLTVVESPQLPVRPKPRGVLKKGALALAVGTLLGILLAFAIHLLARSRHEDANEYEEFVALRRAALDDLFHPWRPLRRFSRVRRVD